MMARLPTFNSKFLEHICRQLERRTKALKHKGKLTWETTQPDEYEWLNLYFEPYVGHWCIFQFVQDNCVSVSIRSKSRANRGKVFLKIEDINLVDNAEAIVAAIESTINHSIEAGTDDVLAPVDAIRKSWSAVEMKTFQDNEE